MAIKAEWCALDDTIEGTRYFINIFPHWEYWLSENFQLLFRLKVEDFNLLTIE